MARRCDEKEESVLYRGCPISKDRLEWGMRRLETRQGHGRCGLCFCRSQTDMKQARVVLDDHPERGR